MPNTKTYDEIYQDFSWSIPENYNIAKSACIEWAEKEPERVCLLHHRINDTPLELTYRQLDERSSSLANALQEKGIKKGARVAILLPQGFNTAIAHIAIYKLGAIAVPLALLFGADAIEYRLNTSDAATLITNQDGYEKTKSIKANLTTLITEHLGEKNATTLDEIYETYSAEFKTAKTNADTPALMIFTSGTTGPAKGALHGHKVLLGHLPGVQFHHEDLPQENDRLWTPADWAWAGGLLNVLLPGLHFGVGVVSSVAEKFDPEAAFQILQDMRIRNTFIPPTALRILKTVNNPAAKYNLNLRTIGSGGEALGQETFEWAKNELGIEINEFYGQTECNLVLSSNNALGVFKPGAIGKPVPGHTVSVIDAKGNELPSGEAGQIAIKRPDPVMFIEYWGRPKATEKKFIGDWLLTGDQGIRSQDGYIEFFGRDDDVITSSGYRIGPGEIEDCLVGHDAVTLAAVIGKPDPIRTEIVKAYVVLNSAYEESEALVQSLKDWVKTRLAAYEYPREIEFVSELPLTTTGKVIRRILRDRAKAEINL